MAVLTPCSASFSAIPRPMPRELPVMSAVFPRRDISTSFVLSGGPIINASPWPELPQCQLNQWFRYHAALLVAQLAYNGSGGPELALSLRAFPNHAGRFVTGGLPQQLQTELDLPG